MNVPQTSSKHGLRERKKAKTKEAIQRHALRLFHEQGYDTTTIEQIAEAAEISPSTFFRYFPTKEDAVLYDALDPLIFAALESQPPELSPIQAFRAAMVSVLTHLSSEEVTQMEERAKLAMLTPELRMRMLDEFASTVDILSGMIAKRTGRKADELEVQVFSGALIGALFAVSFAAFKEPQQDFIGMINKTFLYMESGMSL